MELEKKKQQERGGNSMKASARRRRGACVRGKCRGNLSKQLLASGH